MIQELQADVQSQYATKREMAKVAPQVQAYCDEAFCEKEYIETFVTKVSEKVAKVNQIAKELQSQMDVIERDQADLGESLSLKADTQRVEKIEA